MLLHTNTNCVYTVFTPCEAFGLRQKQLAPIFIFKFGYNNNNLQNV